MTTIAYRDGVMAADTGCSGHGAIHTWAYKLLEHDNVLYGGAGFAAEVQHYFANLQKSGKKILPRSLENDHSSFTIMRVRAETPSTVQLLTAHGWETYHSVPYLAIGAGADPAMGALYAGASAKEAIRAAIAHGEGTFGDVVAVTHR